MGLGYTAGREITYWFLLRRRREMDSISSFANGFVTLTERLGKGESVLATFFHFSFTFKLQKGRKVAWEGEGVQKTSLTCLCPKSRQRNSLFAYAFTSRLKSMQQRSLFNWHLEVCSEIFTIQRLATDTNLPCRRSVRSKQC